MDYQTLIYLLLAHFAADFPLQTRKMVEQKGWVTKQMGIHILVVFALTWIFSGKWQLALLIAPIHYVIDGLKTMVEKQNWGNRTILFLGDQILHVLSIGFIWAGTWQNCKGIFHLMITKIMDFEGSVVLLGYVVVIWPVAYLIKITTTGLIDNNSNFKGTESNEKVKGGEKSLNQAGKLIGQFERIIILTLVLLGEYQAIGFLITGKSILRFADINGKFFSEYVLVGTMMSYALAIMVGVLIKVWIN